MGKTVLDGVCRFCGQMIHVEVEANSNIETTTEAATMQCECEAAKEYQMTIRGKRKIDEMFEADYPECAKILKSSIPDIISHRIKEVVVDTGWSVKGRLKKKDGKLVVKREEKHDKEVNVK